MLNWRLRSWSVLRVFEVSAALLVGAVSGIGFFTFFFADGLAYLKRDPLGCANCHVMKEKYDSWARNSHGHVAVCNDCHLPDSFLGKWATKADNGMRHSFVFTFLQVPTHIRAIPRSRRVVDDNCQRCHAPMARHPIGGANGQQESLSCVGCHEGVGHEH